MDSLVTGSWVTRRALTATEQLFWYFDQIYPGNAGLNVVGHWLLEGEVETELIEEAWGYLSVRHEALRAHFDMVGSELMTIVASQIPFSVHLYDLRGIPGQAAQIEADRIAAAEGRRPFALSAAPLFRLSRIVHSEVRSTLLLTAHRAICDRRSLEILMQQMADICAALQRGEAISTAAPMASRRLVNGELKALNTKSIEAAIVTTRELFEDYKQFELLTDNPRPPTQTSSFSVSSVLLGSTAVSLLAKIGQENGFTTFKTLVAVVLSLFHRYSGESAVLIGTQANGEDEAGLDDVVGSRTETRLTRGDFSGDPTFTEFLQRLRDSEPRAFVDLPSSRLPAVADVKRDLSRNPLCTINCSFERRGFRGTSLERFSVVELPSHSPGLLYDLNIVVTQTAAQWSLVCEYNRDLFENDTVDTLLGALETLMGAIVANPDQRISRMPVVSETSRERLVVEANRTQMDLPFERTVAELVSAQALKSPTAIAVECGERTLTYAQLDAASNRLARELVRREFGPQQRVGVLLERSVDLVTALLAVLKAGSAYVPLDPGYPQDRLAYIVSHSRLAAVISRSTLSSRIVVGGARFLNVDTDDLAIALNSDEPLSASPTMHDPAYIIYTSGSTGQPKGVAVGQRGFVNVLQAVSRADAFDITARDVHVAVATISFDIATLELFLPLINGARLVIATESEVADSRRLHRLVQRSGATFMQGTPITWELLMEAGWVGDPPLKILCGGEAISRRLADRLLERGNIMWNGYGPTETTILSSICRVSPGTGPVLIGPPLANTQFYVLDVNGELVPPGVAGELYIGGDGVALGYFERPALTQERFLPDRFRALPRARLYRTGDVVRRRGRDLFEFLGRSDQQIKVRGYRIELGEIEAGLLRQPDVKEAVVVVRGDTAVDKAIWAFVVPKHELGDNADVWISHLRSRLSESLPHYMVPAPIVILPALPRTPNSKIDRKALPETAGSPRAGRPSANGQARHVLAANQALLQGNDIASVVARVWSDILGSESYDGDQRWDDAGGNSLLTLKLAYRLERLMHKPISLELLSPAMRPSELIRRLSDSRDAVSRSAPNARTVVLFPGLLGDEPSLVQFRKLFNDDIRFFIPTYMPWDALVRGGISFSAMIGDIVNQIRQDVNERPLVLVGYSFGGVIAHEVARRFVDCGDAVAFVGILDTDLGFVSAGLRRKHAERAVLARVYRRLDVIVHRLRRVVLIAAQLSRRLPHWSKIAFWFQHNMTRIVRAELATTWRPGTLATSTTLYRSQSQASDIIDDLGWSRYTPALHVESVNGTHRTMLVGPNGQQLALKIRQEIAASLGIQ